MKFSLLALFIFATTSVSFAKPQVFELEVSPCKGKKDCLFVVESTRKVELSCYYSEKPRDAIKLDSVFIENECRIVVTEKKSGKKYDIYAGAEGCKSKAGDLIKLNIERPKFRDTCGLNHFQCIKAGNSIQIDPAESLSIPAKYCNSKQGGWIDRKLLPPREKIE